jgi:hypothetical protein
MAGMAGMVVTGGDGGQYPWTGCGWLEGQALGGC